MDCFRRKNNIFEGIVSNNVSTLRPRAPHIKSTAVANLVAKVVQIVFLKQAFVTDPVYASVGCPGNLIANKVHANALKVNASLVGALPACVPAVRDI